MKPPIGPLRLDVASKDLSGDWRYTLGVGWKFKCFLGLLIMIIVILWLELFPERVGLHSGETTK